MSSTPMTGGFSVNALPNVQFADPRLFNPYGAVASGLSSGVNMGAQLQDIQLRQQAAEAEAQMRPLRQQLLQAELAGAKQRQHLADIEMPGKELVANQPVVVEHNTFTDFDENGNLAEYRREKKVDARTGEVSYAPRIYSRTLKTKQQLEDEKLNAEAMRGYRDAMGGAAQIKAATAQQIADYKAAHPTVKTERVFGEDGPGGPNVFEQVINPDGTRGAIWQVVLPNGQPAKRPKSGLSDFAALFPLAPRDAPGAPVPSGPPVPGLAAANLDALRRLADQLAAQPKVFASEAEAQAAARANPPLVRPGDKITVAGVPGTWH